MLTILTAVFNISVQVKEGPSRGSGGHGVYHREFISKEKRKKKTI